MKRQALKAFVLIIVFAVVLIGGCGGQNEPPDVKKSRAIAAENIELKKQLAQNSREISKLKGQHKQGINEQKQLLAECLKEKEIWKQKSQQNIRSQVKGVLDTVLEENKKLRDENTRLKTQIKELQKQPQ